MQRVLAILLIALLPLQSNWAAAATLSALCGMADGDAMHDSHVGHHDAHGHADQHAGLDATPEHCQEASSAETDSHDGSCGNCHTSCCTLTGAAAAFATPQPAAGTPDNGGALDIPSAARQRPERPKWIGLA